MICLWCGEKLERVDWPDPFVVVAFRHANAEDRCPLPVHQRADAPTLLERLCGPDEVEMERAGRLVERR